MKFLPEFLKHMPSFIRGFVIGTSITSSVCSALMYSGYTHHHSVVKRLEDGNEKLVKRLEDGNEKLVKRLRDIDSFEGACQTFNENDFKSLGKMTKDEAKEWINRPWGGFWMFGKQFITRIEERNVASVYPKKTWDFMYDSINKKF